MENVFTSESVTEGHPDKICDQISDAIVDAFIKEDSDARVAVETLAAKDCIILAGEVNSTAKINFEQVVRETLKKIGYNKKYHFDPEEIDVQIHVHAQSPDIAQGVDETAEHEQGAGDQGIMFGYASDNTKELMPLPILLAHNLTRGLAQARREGTLAFLGPDGKAQVTVEYEDREPQRVATVVIASQHDDIDEETVRKGILEKVVKPICGKYFDERTNVIINGTGRFVIGGPYADAGLTGRKIIVDTYGGKGRHGGGCFSGKDASKVDRSGAYMARHVAKTIVAAGYAKEAEVQLGYCIGVAEPVSVRVETFGTGKKTEEELISAVRKAFPLKPRAIIEYLGLCKPIFERTAAYGHFGRAPEADGGFSWENTSKSVENLKKAFE